MLDHHLSIIEKYYGDAIAQRSQVPLINHIHEGLVILNHENAKDVVKAAYCIHPVIQDTADFQNELQIRALHTADSSAIMLACEYRSLANSYLSNKDLTVVEKTQLRSDLNRMAPVRLMLVADKIQNRKDFEIYHEGTHPNSDRLTSYFHDWMLILDISESRYQIYKELLELE